MARRGIKNTSDGPLVALWLAVAGLAMLALPCAAARRGKPPIGDTPPPAAAPVPGTAPLGRYEDYDGTFTFFSAVAPAFWLAIVGLCLIVMLWLVGYLSVPDATDAVAEVASALRVKPDIVARRSALAYSGVTAAITVALSLASFVWAGSAFRGKAPAYRRRVLRWVLPVLAIVLARLVWRYFGDDPPFASTLGTALLEASRENFSAFLLKTVPLIMLCLACLVPAGLAAGAGFLLQPMAQASQPDAAQAQRRVLAGRLLELDKLLYVGALALVFGTLQLSAALSVPLASAPKLADLKTQADLCKTLAPSPASSPFFTPASVPSVGPPFFKGFGIEQCRTLPREFARGDVVDSLRQLVRGVTLATGLAFTALLAAIYVPALIGLNLMIRPRLEAIGSQKEDDDAIGDTDPLRRIAALVATLSPLIAGLIANAFATG